MKMPHMPTDEELAEILQCLEQKFGLLTTEDTVQIRGDGRVTIITNGVHEISGWWDYNRKVLCVTREEVSYYED